MKRAVLLPVILLLACGLQAQINYKVIKVNGTIQYVRTGSQMALGDVFPENEDLSFATPNSRAAVINPEKGRFILTPQSASQLSGAKSNFLPAMSNISTRGGALNNLTAIQNQFDGTLSILYEASWHINPYQFPQDDGRFFYLRFRYHGEEINKKLLHRENQLVFSREDILRVDGRPIPGLDSPAVILYYYTGEGPQFINEFELVFPKIKVLRQEAGIILEEFGRYDYNRKVNEIAGYLFDFYGKPDKEDVMLFLEKDFGLKR
jgi:hypothetical protein